MLNLTDDQGARLVLMRATRPPAKSVQRLVLKHGPLSALQMLLRNEAPDPVNDEICTADTDLLPDLEALTSGAVRLVTPEDAEWPAKLFPVPGRSVPYTTPLGLWVRGETSLSEIPASLAIAGWGDPTRRGRQIAAAFAGEHASRGTTIVTSYPSALARATLEATLSVGGVPVVVLASALDTAYDDQALLTRTVDQGGLLISQHPIGTPGPSRRQRATTQGLAVALANATLIVEAPDTKRGKLPAAVGSGLGRRVFAITGSETPESAGANSLIEQGIATPVAVPDDIADHELAASPPALAHPA